MIPSSITAGLRWGVGGMEPNAQELLCIAQIVDIQHSALISNKPPQPHKLQAAASSAREFQIRAQGARYRRTLYESPR